MYYFLIAGLVVILDQLTKLWVVNNFQLYESKAVIPGVANLVYVTNTGAAFSLFADVESPWRHYFFLAVGGAALIGLTIAYFRYYRTTVLYGAALALIAGGAAGNLLDRLRYGSVVDFIDIYVGTYHWPAFNIADSAICVGAGLFIVTNILEAREKKDRSAT